MYFKAIYTLYKHTKIWMSWWMTSWPWASSVPWLPRRPMGSWGASRGVWPAGQGRFSFPLPWWGPIWSRLSSSGFPSSRKLKSYWRESSGGLRGWWGDWSISPTRRGWGRWACSAWRREGWEGISSMPLNICRVGVRRKGSDSFQWCPATGQGATGTKWSKGSSSWTWGRTSSLWGWRSPGPGCPGRLWSLLLWRYSRPSWTRFCAACCRWPYFSRGVGLGDPQRSLPTPTILWFCDLPLPLSRPTSLSFSLLLSNWGEGVIERLWWAPGTQPGSTHYTDLSRDEHSVL